MAPPITLSFLSSPALIYFLLLFTQQISPVKSASCGRLSTCDYLISYSIFQRGTCGRAARCYWELLHLEKFLEGDSNNVPMYEAKIKERLCDIPTLGAYDKIRQVHKDPAVVPYSPCYYPKTFDPGKVTQYQADIMFYPMTTLYTFWEGNNHENHVYLTRLDNCVQDEFDCNNLLQNKVDTLCNSLKPDSVLQDLEKSFEMKLRGKPFYQLAHLHLKSPPLTSDDNRCSLLHLIRKREETTGKSDKQESKFADKHVLNQLDKRLRGPYFDLNLLYVADPKKKFASVPIKDRWWNENKAYQELAHYMPEDMLTAIHAAIKCVFLSRVGTPENELQASLDKFCSGKSAFTCVEKAMLKGNNCGANRHDINYKKVDDP